MSVSESQLPTVGALPTKAEIIQRLERMEISADAKAILSNLAAITVDVGGQIIQAGRRILQYVFDLVTQFPNTTFGAIIAYVLSGLVASVPVLGLVLGPLLAPLLLAFGIAVGAMADKNERQLRVRYEYLEREFQMLTKRG